MQFGSDAPNRRQVHPGRQILGKTKPPLQRRRQLELCLFLTAFSRLQPVHPSQFAALTLAAHRYPHGHLPRGDEKRPVSLKPPRPPFRIGRPEIPRSEQDSISLSQSSSNLVATGSSKLSMIFSASRARERGESRRTSFCSRWNVIERDIAARLHPKQAPFLKFYKINIFLKNSSSPHKEAAAFRARFMSILVIGCFPVNPRSRFLRGMSRGH
jgi:hypothetical protein